MVAYDFLEPEAVTNNDVNDVNALLAQLTTSAKPITHNNLAMVASQSHLLVARDDSKHIKGMATLCILHKPTGLSGVIEDVYTCL